MKKSACVISNGHCTECFYADECNRWLDVAPYNTAEIDEKAAYMELCEGRHKTPATDGALFATDIDPVDVCGLERQAKEKLSNLNIKELNLYVTGLTVALVAALNAAKELGIQVTLWHFNRENGEYYCQKVR